MRIDLDTLHNQCNTVADQSKNFVAALKREHEAALDLWRHSPAQDNIARFMAEQERAREALQGPFSQIAKRLEEERALHESLVGPSSHMAKILEQDEKLRAALVIEVPKWAEEYKTAFEGSQGLFASKAMQDVFESAKKAHEAFDFTSLQEQAGLMEKAFESISDLRRQSFELPPIQPRELPPNPILETNERLQAVEEQAAGTRVAVSELGKMVGNLGVLGAEMQARSEKVQNRSLLIANISTVAAIVAVLLAGAQVWVQFSDSAGRARLESRIDELQAAQVRSAEDAAKLRADNARLTAEIKALRGRSAPRTGSRSR
jgi:hypothetical protein